MEATTVVIDLAKDVFEVALANRAGHICERKRLTRHRFERFLSELPAGTEVVMEACGTAHYWGRYCQARDLRVRLLPAQYVRPYVHRNKTDRTDTEALLEAGRCGGIQEMAGTGVVLGNEAITDGVFSRNGQTIVVCPSAPIHLWRGLIDGERHLPWSPGGSVVGTVTA